MAISLRGSATGLTGGTTTGLAFTLPTGHTANDLLIALIGVKPYTLSVSSGTLTTDGWTQRSQGANGTTANGLDAGSVWASIYTKVHDGSESNPTGTLSGTPSPRMSGMIAFQSTLTGSGWSLASTNASDATGTGSTLSATGAASLEVANGDEFLVLVVHKTDAATHSSPALTVGTATVTNLTQRFGTKTTNSGNDGAMYVYTADITSADTAAPVFTATVGGTDVSDAQVIFLRIREPQNRTGTVTGAAPATSGTVTGTKTQSQNLSGTVTGEAPATSGTVTGSSQRTGTVTGEAPATSGTVTGSSQRTGTVTGEATVTGTVFAGEHHEGTVTGDATATGTVAGTSGRAGTVTGEATASATATGTTGRAGIVTGEATVSGVIVAGEHHEGTVTGEATVSGSVFGTAEQGGNDKTGTVTGDASATGTIAGAKATSGTVTAQATVTGTVGPAPTPAPQPTPTGGGYLVEFARRPEPRKPCKGRVLQAKAGRVSAVAIARAEVRGSVGHTGTATAVATATCTIRPGRKDTSGAALADIAPQVRVTGVAGTRDPEYLALYAELRRTRDDHDLLLLL